MNRPKLVIVFLIYFIFCFSTVFYEKAVYRESLRQMERIDYAFQGASRSAGEALKNHVYEEDVYELVEQTFLYTYATLLGAKDKDEIISETTDVEQIIFFVNGAKTPPEELTWVKDSDVLELHISLKDICISAYGRKRYISRYYANTVR